ncbi:MAG: hypothetical protein RBU24_10460 [Kiritimatiellia bacterium]|jgi:hypothetical protein|nr:hypothetical protein [Kiritimatiellia bacterium]
MRETFLVLGFMGAAAFWCAAQPGAAGTVQVNAASGKRLYTCYRSFWPELETTADFGRLGIDTRCFFAANAINSAGFEYCKYPLIWQGVKKYNFAAYDKQVDDLLAANPRARLLCMIDLNTPYWLTRKLAYDSFDVISHAATDPQWLKLTTVWMLDFIAYSEKKYGDRIDAYILSGGGTSEWYEYDRGKSSRVKNAAWRAWCKRNGFVFGEDVPPESSLRKAAHENVIYDPAAENDKIQYWRFHNEVIADAILHFAKTARPAIGKEKELGVFFGYYMVSDNKLVSFGHLDYERVMASPDLDFFISPGTYNDRMIGGGSGPQLVQGTLLRHGKRYLHEIDHRTHAVGNGWKTQAEDNAGLTREAAYALVNHASLWWFDMWGGWFNKEETRGLIGRITAVSAAYADDRSPSIAEVLLVADPQSACYLNEKMPHASAMAHRFRDQVSRTGAPYDVYSFNDLAVIDLSRYKAVFLPATLLITPERADLLMRRVLKNGRTVVWAYAPGICDGKSLDIARVKQWTGSDYKTPGPAAVAMDGWTSVYAFEYKTLTPFALREIMRRAGVHLYVEGENPVFANARLLAVHCKEGGEKKISLPQSCKKVVDVLTGTTIAENATSFTYRFEKPDTALFELKR